MVENRYLFNAVLKAFCDKSGDRSAGGRLFQVVGPLASKLRCPVAVRSGPVAVKCTCLISRWNCEITTRLVKDIAMLLMCDRTYTQVPECRRSGFQRRPNHLVGHIRYYSHLHMSTWPVFSRRRYQENIGLHKWNLAATDAYVYRYDMI